MGAIVILQSCWHGKKRKVLRCKKLNPLKSEAFTNAAQRVEKKAVKADFSRYKSIEEMRRNCVGYYRNMNKKSRVDILC